MFQVLNWNESIISFFFTLTIFGSGFVALFIPWRLILLWTSRLVVWIFLGPWMRILDLFFHEETERQKEKASTAAVKLFHTQQKAAKILREQALKMKAFRVKLFGQFITRLPEFNLTRHEDVPLPESSAEPYQSKEEIKTVKFVPSQDLSGSMIPMTGQDAVESEARKKKEKDCLLGKYQKMVNEKPESLFALEDEWDEGFELIGTEDHVVCLHSESSEVATGMKELESTLIAPARSNSERDVVLSDKAIQLALEKELHQDPKKAKRPKSKWIFSAKVSLSLRKEAVEDLSATPALESPDNPARLCDSSNLIEDTVQEEGVEIVPFLSGSAHDDMAKSGPPLELENDSDHVSVLYVKDETSPIVMSDANELINSNGTALGVGNDEYAIEDRKLKLMMDDDVTANSVKKIRFRKALSEID
ncbi:hypothetical protein ACHAXR_004052 [Thalassiosira sp. AJA248-18]